VARISDMKMRYRIFMKNYKYRSLEWKRGVSLRKPLSKSRIAIVSTAALHTPDQEPFDGSVSGGDTSFRVIREDTQLETLRETHPSESFDHGGLEADPNLAMPTERFRELKAQGKIGDSAPRHLSFMGIILNPEKLINETAAQAAEILAEDKVDGVLLVPV